MRKSIHEYCSKCYPRLCSCPMTKEQEVAAVSSALAEYKNVLTAGEKQALETRLQNLRGG